MESDNTTIRSDKTSSVNMPTWDENNDTLMAGKQLDATT